MLTDKRIKEAQSNFNSYLQDGLVAKKKEFEQRIFNILENNANESLKIAEMLFANQDSRLWTIVTSYYSMYYIANAVLYKMGYKVGEKIPHKVTADCLIALVRDKLKASLLEQYEEMQQDALQASKQMKSYNHLIMKGKREAFFNTRQVKK